MPKSFKKMLHERNTKMKRTTKITSILLCFVLLLSSVVGFASFAAESSYTAEITGKNVVYGAKMYMAIAVTTNETGVGVATFASADATTPIHTSYSKGADTKGNEFYYTYGIAAKEINTTFYYAVVDAAGNEISARLPYSVAAYANERLGDADITAKQEKLYNSILSYGTAADTVFGTNK